MFAACLQSSVKNCVWAAMQKRRLNLYDSNDFMPGVAQILVKNCVLDDMPQLP